MKGQNATTPKTPTIGGSGNNNRSNNSVHANNQSSSSSVTLPSPKGQKNSLAHLNNTNNSKENKEGLQLNVVPAYAVAAAGAGGGGGGANPASNLDLGSQTPDVVSLFINNSVLESCTMQIHVHVYMYFVGYNFCEVPRICFSWEIIFVINCHPPLLSIR